jgi:hypothetical protein
MASEKHEHPGAIALTVERVVLPSRVRRGRLAVSPVWRVAVAENVWQFGARKEAAAFVAAGGCSHIARESLAAHTWCPACRGYIVERTESVINRGSTAVTKTQPEPTEKTGGGE